MNKLLVFTVFSLLVCVGCYKGPEDLPKLKKKFKAQISGFENQKDDTDVKVEKAVEKLSTFQQALKNAEDTDKEFKRVYGQWNKVNNEVKSLNKEYNKLKDDANNLFNAMEAQTNSLKDANTRNELNRAIRKIRTDYSGTLRKTEKAVNSLNLLHDEALEIVKALEVAYAVGEISNISSGLRNIENRVDQIMQDLNTSISESKELYDKRIGVIGGRNPS